MPILVCGINHKTAPVSLREKVMFAAEKLPLYLHDLVTNESIREAVLLSTCNRSELYCEAEEIEQVKAWFCRQHTLSRDDIEPALYIYQDQAAIEHIMQVACGLDSLVIGESQILGQMKDAFSESCAAGSVGTLFNRLFQQVFAVVKEVRNASAIGACPMSVSSATVSFVKQTFLTQLQEATLVLVGAGVTMNLVLRHLKTESPKRILIANRSKENALALAKEYHAECIRFSELADTLSTADVLITATGSTLPLVTTHMIKPRKKPLYIIDIAVPRDVEPAIGEIEHVHLHSIDDLKNIMQQNRMRSEHAAEKAREMIKQKSHEFITWLNSFEMVASTIRAYRQQIESLCDVELTKALRRLQQGDEATDVLLAFSRAFTNKLLHTPSVQLRQAGFAGRFDILQLARELLAIPHPESELI